MRAPVARFRPPVLIFVGFVVIQAVSAAVLFATKLGLAPASIEAFYLGSELAMTRPRSLAGLLEVAVPHLLAIPLTLFIVIHLVGWAGIVRKEALEVLARLSFALAGVGLMAGMGVRYLWPGLSAVKLGVPVVTGRNRSNFAYTYPPRENFTRSEPRVWGQVRPWTRRARC